MLEGSLQCCWSVAVAYASPVEVLPVLVAAEGVATHAFTAICSNILSAKSATQADSSGGMVANFAFRFGLDQLHSGAALPGLSACIVHFAFQIP